MVISDLPVAWQVVVHIVLGLGVAVAILVCVAGAIGEDKWDGE